MQTESIRINFRQQSAHTKHEMKDTLNNAKSRLQMLNWFKTVYDVIKSHIKTKELQIEIRKQSAENSFLFLKSQLIIQKYYESNQTFWQFNVLQRIEAQPTQGNPVRALVAKRRWLKLEKNF